MRNRYELINEAERNNEQLEEQLATTDEFHPELVEYQAWINAISWAIHEEGPLYDHRGEIRDRFSDYRELVVGSTDSGLDSDKVDAMADPTITSIAEKMVDSYPNLSITTQTGVDGNQYIMLQLFDDEDVDRNKEAPSKFLSMIQELDDLNELGNR